MKQKILIKVSMSGKKCRSKAMQIAVGVPGVDSAALKGADKTQIEVVGDGVDAVCLVTLLRKNIGYAELVSLSEVKPEAKKDNPSTKTGTAVHNMVWAHSGGVPMFHVEDIGNNIVYDPCSIM